MSAYREAVATLLRGGELGGSLAQATMTEVLDGALTPAQVGGLLAALARRVETVDELVGFAQVMRSRALRVRSEGEVIDTCGTGGSGQATPNTSTAVAFLLAAAGVKVAKHGNRASSGVCGSADVLEELGIALDLEPEALGDLLEAEGVAFLFAQRLHPALKVVGPIRRELGFRTVFNFLGPLCNPAGATRQLLGVSDANRAPRMAQALARLGTRRALVATGDDGLDELSLSAPTRLWELRDGEVRAFTLDPRDLGLSLASPDALVGGDRRRNAELLLEVLDGRARGPRADHVALNTGAGLYVAGRATTLAQGVGQARELMASGAGREVVERYRSASQRIARAA